jgi:hypothetical protein
MPRQLIKPYFWVCLRGCFGNRLAFESLNLVKKLTNRVSIIKPVSIQKEQRGTEKWIFFLYFLAGCPWALKLLGLRPSDSGTDKCAPYPVPTQVPRTLDSDWKLYHQPSSTLVLRCLDLDWMYHWLSWFSSLQMADHCPSNLLNCMSQFSKVSC